MNISEKELSSLEKAAMEKANRAITSIESAMAACDALETKPYDLRERMQRLKYYHEELSAWYSSMLKKKGDAAEGRISRLRKLYELCQGWRD